MGGQSSAFRCLCFRRLFLLVLGKDFVSPFACVSLGHAAFRRGGAVNQRVAVLMVAVSARRDEKSFCLDMHLVVNFKL